MNKYFLIVYLILFAACSGNTKNNTTDCPCRFTTVEMPAIITEPYARAEFLVMHYWDNFDFADTACVNNDDVTEQAFSNYINILEQVISGNSELADKSITAFMQRAKVDSTSYRRFADIAERYLDDPNSPMRNEAIYMGVLQHMLDGDALSPLEKVRPQARKEMLLKNRVGERANNFEYTLSDGRRGDLYNINTAYTLLFINNPDCQACKEVIDALMVSVTASQMRADGKLTILAFYPDEDIELWRKNLSKFPEQWINAYDAQQTMREKSLYDLRAIPTLYLLDKNKKVLIKDFVSVEQFDAYFTR